MTMKLQPATISGGLAAGTAAIGALLAYDLSQKEALAGSDAQKLVWAFLLCGLFAVATLLFALGDRRTRKEAA